MDLQESRRTLVGVGFTDIVTDVIDLAWCCSNGEDLLAMIYKSVVRMPMLLERQTREPREHSKAGTSATRDADQDSGPGQNG